MTLFEERKQQQNRGKSLKTFFFCLNRTLNNLTLTKNEKTFITNLRKKSRRSAYVSNIGACGRSWFHDFFSTLLVLLLLIAHHIEINKWLSLYFLYILTLFLFFFLFFFSCSSLFFFILSFVVVRYRRFPFFFFFIFFLIFCYLILTTNYFITLKKDDL